MSENTGHGHVFPRPDGVKARCGGPGLCLSCTTDKFKRDRLRIEAMEAEIAGLKAENVRLKVQVEDWQRRYNDMRSAR